MEKPIERKPLCPLAVEAKRRLIELNKPQTWLIERVAEDTGLYVDNGLMQRIWRGECHSPRLTTSIRKVLGIGET